MNTLFQIVNRITRPLLQGNAIITEHIPIQLKFERREKIVRYARIQGGNGVGENGSRPPLENHKAIGFLSNTGPDPLENKKSYQASIQCWAIIGSPAKRHLNALVVFGSHLPTSTKKIVRIAPHTL